jgi:hypothetical protein
MDCAAFWALFFSKSYGHHGLAWHWFCIEERAQLQKYCSSEVPVARKKTILLILFAKLLALYV